MAKVEQEQFSELLNFYKKHVSEQLLPFWDRAFDTVNGGVYTCFNNDGDQLINTDKYTWSQGRFLWVWSRLCQMVGASLIYGPREGYLEQMKKTVDYLLANVFLENGRCCFLLSERGDKLQVRAGEGYDSSIYADCFVMIGLTEYGRMTQDREIVERAYALYSRIEDDITNGNFRSEPYPIPVDFDAHGLHMIMLDMSTQLYDSLVAMNDIRSNRIAGKMAFYIDSILHRFCDSSHRIRELISNDAQEQSAEEYLVSRHLNPGHSLECMWFVMLAAKKIEKKEAVLQAVQVIKKMFTLGWDQAYGGLLRYVDLDGGQPTGARLGGKFEQLVEQTWDMKLWWPHSEALYTTMLAYDLTGDPEMMELYSQIHEYTFKTFPHPDPNIGEWIQIRTRDGTPANLVVALPVKDPYHILRNCLLMIELLDRKVAHHSSQKQRDANEVS